MTPYFVASSWGENPASGFRAWEGIMSRGSDPRTSIGLLARLSRVPSDPEAWAEFVKRYGKKIYFWCRSWNLQDADAQDVTQNVLLEIARKMQTFQYDPSGSFRGWLKTVAYGAWCNFLSNRKPQDRASGDSQVQELLQTMEAGEDLAQQLEEQYDGELLKEATRRVRLRVEPKTWEAFRLLAYEDLSGKEAADHLGIKVASVYMAKSRVQKMLQDEIRKLEAECETTP